MVYQIASRSYGMSILILLCLSFGSICFLIINSLLSYFQIKTPISISFSILFMLIAFVIKIYGSFGRNNKSPSNFIASFCNQMIKAFAAALNSISWGTFILLLAVLFTAITLNNNQKSQSLNLKDNNKKSDFNVSFVYQKNEIETTPSLIYVGSTNNYIFLYDRVFKHSKIYEKTNVHDFEIWK